MANANTAKNTLQEFSNKTNTIADSLSASNQIVIDLKATAGADEGYVS